MKTLIKKDKMRIISFVLIWIISILIFYPVNASCVIQGYAKNYSGDYNGASVNAYCELDNSWRNITRIAGDLYGVSWGGPADSCQSKCVQVYISANSRSVIPENPELIGYTIHYPMNRENTLKWNDRIAHNTNITLVDIEKAVTKKIKKGNVGSSSSNQIKEFNQKIVINQENGKPPTKIENKKSIDQLSWFYIIWGKITKFIYSTFH